MLQTLSSTHPTGMVDPSMLRRAAAAKQAAGDSVAPSIGQDPSMATANQLRAAALKAQAAPPSDPRDTVINAANPGQEFNFQDKLVPGKLNIVEFYSPACPHCTEMAPRLQELVKKNPDVVVLRMDINRANAQGIDWDSPLTKQYGIDQVGVPFFAVYQADGSEVANDSDNHKAAGTVEALMQQAGIK